MSEDTEDKEEPSKQSQYGLFTYFYQSRTSSEFKLKTSHTSHTITKNSSQSRLITQTIQSGIYELVLPDSIFYQATLTPILTYFDDPKNVDIESMIAQIIDEKGQVTDFVLAIDYLQMNSFLHSVKEYIKMVLGHAPSADKIREVLKFNDDFTTEEKNICKQLWASWCSPNAQQCDLSVSSILEGKSQNRLSITSPPPEIYFLLSRPAFFVPDDSATGCHNCTVKFTNICRRSHCRGCGRLFCRQCVSFFLNLPVEYQVPGPAMTMSSITNYLPGSTGDVKVCEKCFNFLSKDGRLSNELRGLDTLDLDLNLLKRAGTSCAFWKKACTFLLSLLREIHYRLPTHVFTEREKRVLRCNRHLWAGHSRWLVLYLKTVDWTDKDLANEAYALLLKPRVYKCTELMCSRLCKENLTPQDALELLGSEIKDVRVRNFAMKPLMELSLTELQCYLPVLLHHLKFELAFKLKSHLVEFLIKKAQEDVVFRTDLYWSLLRESKNDEIFKILQLLISRIGQELTDQLLKGVDFVRLLESVNDLDVQNLRKFLKEKLEDILATGDLYLPLDPKKKVLKFHYEDIEIKSSATKPIVLPCTCLDVEKNTEVYFKILVKKEDIRKDHIVLSIIKLMSFILKKEQGLDDIPIITYQVLPTSSDRGMIEMVQNSQTLCSLRTADNIINTLIDNTNTSISGYNLEPLRISLAQSTAAYLVMTYFLGVGDRHTDNIMIHNNGILFHIDYGFILGQSPKPFMPYMMFTKTLIDAMGGEKSSHYKTHFKDICPRIYTVLRRHVGLFTNLLRLVPGFDDSYVERQVMETFLPGMSEEDAEAVFSNRMEVSTDAIPQVISEQVRSIQKSSPLASVWGYASSYWK